MQRNNSFHHPFYRLHLIRVNRITDERGSAFAEHRIAARGSIVLTRAVGRIGIIATTTSSPGLSPGP